MPFSSTSLALAVPDLNNIHPCKGGYIRAGHKAQKKTQKSWLKEKTAVKMVIDNMVIDKKLLYSQGLL